jgi:hypothetical protein
MLAGVDYSQDKDQHLGLIHHQLVQHLQSIKKDFGFHHGQSQDQEHYK